MLTRKTQRKLARIHEAASKIIYLIAAICAAAWLLDSAMLPGDVRLHQAEAMLRDAGQSMVYDASHR